MKKLLSICFLSMLLALAGFNANAQCCFWVENLQPDTVYDVSNFGINQGGDALLPGEGNPLILTNNLTPVYSVTADGRTDWYQLHFGECANPNTKVSLEWKLYRDGNLLSDADISRYADIYIYTKFNSDANTDNVNATCGHSGWMGGKVNGAGVCQVSGAHCLGGYPGSTVVNPNSPYASNGYDAAGYVQLPGSYNLDYFYYAFLQSTETRIAIHWKQAGNYALVVGLRERTNGTDFSIWQDDNQNAFIGGHQSCCGDLLASDSLTYLVTTTDHFAVCEDGSLYYGQPNALYTIEGVYNVLFGTETCDHWEVDSIVNFSFYVRTRPDVVAYDLSVCKNEELNPETDILGIYVQAQSTDAPGYLGHTIYWRKLNNESESWSNWSSTIPSFATDVPGEYTYQVYQSNHYDAVTGQDFWCDGDVATFVMTVKDVLPPVLYSTNENYDYCYEDLPTTLTLKAKLNNTSSNKCADKIHWFLGTEATGTPVWTTTETNGISSFFPTIAVEENIDQEIKYTAFSYDESTETYSTTGVTVTIHIWKNPILVAEPANFNDSVVGCPNEHFNIYSKFTSSNFNDYELSWEYTWTKNGAYYSSNEDESVYAPGCNEKDVYVVTATATSVYGCETTISRRITVEGIDRDPLTISWRNESSAALTISGCDTTTNDWTAPLTIANTGDHFDNNTSMIFINEDNCLNYMQGSVVYTVDVDATSVPCTTIVTRNYQVKDACGNLSNTISQVVTIVNDETPTFTTNSTATDVDTIWMDNTPVFTEITIGTGTNVHYYLPLYEYYNYSYTEQIYLKNELGGASTINSLSFYCNSYSSLNRNITVYLKHTMKDEYGSVNDYVTAEDAENVFSGNVTLNPGWNTINFTNGFDYDGEQNIVLIVDDNTGSYVSANGYYAHNTGADRSLYVYSDYVNFDANNPISDQVSGSMSYYVNNVKFGTESVVDSYITVKELDPVRPLNNNCESNLPTRAELLAAFHANFDITTGCNATVADEDILFFLGNTTTVADGNTNIFADTDQVMVYATVEDECGNISEKTPVFVLYKPAELYITHGAVYVPNEDYEYCNTDTTTVVFDPLMINNGLAPYTYEWSQTPMPAECGMNVAADMLSAEVWAVQGGAYNTFAQFIMTITDQYGCVATDTSNGIRWYGMPDVTIIERYDNDNYPHTTPVEVCPTFGHYLLTTLDHANLPSSEDQNLRYVWSGEAIDYTSQTNSSFIAVNENLCDRVYDIFVEVENAKGCKANGTYSIHAMDSVAPVITLDMSTDTVELSAGCKITIPDYTHLFTPATVSDNCWNMDSIQVTQEPVAGTIVSGNTPVVITVAPKCGPAATYTIEVCRPEPSISTMITATVDNECFPYTTTFESHTSNFVAPLSIYWDGATVAADTKEFTTDSETENLTHTVRVVDANGCEATAEYTLVVYHTPVAADVTVTTTPNHYCDEEHFDGTITVTSNNPEITGVRVSGDPVYHALPYTITNLPDDTYSFDLTTEHCEKLGITSAVVEHQTTTPIPELRIITDNANCVAPWSGTIEVTNPVEGYVYHISAGAEGSGDETIIYNAAMLNAVRFNYLYQDTYTVSVLSTFNCTGSASITVEDHRVIPTIPTYTTTANTNCITPNGTIVLNNTNSDWMYTINGTTQRGNGALTFENLAGDVEYTLIVANQYTGCKDSVSILVDDESNAPGYPNITFEANTYCVGGNGSIEVNDPVAGFEYTLNPVGTTITSGAVKFEGLVNGSYALTVYDTETECSSTFDLIVPEDKEIPTLNEIVTTPRTVCDVTLSNGTISGFATGFTYIVKDKYENIVSNYSTLDSGSYTVIKIDDITGCQGTDVVYVGYEQPGFDWTATTTEDMDCSNIGTGTIVVTPAASDAVSYEVVDNSGAVVAMTDLNSGNYTVTATVAATGCSYNKVVTVEEAFTYPVISATTTANYHCNDAKNGTIAFEDVATDVNYSSVTFFVDGVESSSPVTTADSGSYIITAISNYNCPAMEAVDAFVEDSAFIIFKYQIVANSLCNPTPSRPGNGQIRILEPQSVNCDYEFSAISADIYDVNHFEPLDYTKYTLQHGSYRVTITDSITGCSLDSIVVVPHQPANVEIVSVESTDDFYCTEGEGNGTITVTAISTSNASVLAYSIDGETYQTSNVFTGVDAGEYVITVKDVTTDCIYNDLANADVTVNPNEYVINIAFDNDVNTACEETLFNGAVHYTVAYADASLGAGDFTVTIEGGSFTGLGGRVYGIYVYDNVTGCTFETSTEVINSNPYTPTINVTAYNYNQNPENYHYCFGQTDGYMIAAASSTLAGDTSFTYTWVSSCDHITPNGAWTNVYTDQAFCCDYTVTAVSNLTGCYNTMSVKICVDTLPVIRFNVTGEAINLVSTTPNLKYENCVNKEFTMGIIDPGFQTIEWTNAYTATNIASFVVPANTLNVGDTSYCVRVVDHNGCSAGPQAVNIHTKPIFETTETFNACNSYHFNRGGVDTTFTFAEGPTHTLVVKYAAVNTCDSVVTYTINLSTDPTLSVDPATETAFNVTYCEGETILTEGPGFVAEHAVRSGWLTTEGEVFDPTAALTYEMNGTQVYAYAVNHCDSIASTIYTLRVIGAPTLATGTLQNATICLGAAAPYDASCIDNIDWHGSVGTATVQYTTDGSTWSELTDVVYPALEDDFKIRIIAENDCADLVTIDGPVTITVNDTVKLKGGADTTQAICLGDGVSIQLEVANATVEFVAEEGSNLTIDASNKITGVPTAAGTYTYTVTATSDVDCGEKTLTGTITVNDTVKLTGDADTTQAICLGEEVSIQLTVANATVVLEAEQGSNLTIDASNKITGVPTAAGTYTYTVTATSTATPSCDAKTLTGIITVKNVVVFEPISETSQTICQDSTIDPIEFNIEYATLTAAGLPDGLDIVNNAIVGAPTAEGPQTYYISVSAVSDESVCNTTQPIPVTIYVNSAPEISPISGAEFRACAGTSFDRPTFDLDVMNHGATITSQGWYYNDEPYDWNTASNLDMNGTLIYFVAQNVCGTASFGIDVVVDTIPVATLVADTSICVEGTAVLTATGGESYQWTRNNAVITEVDATHEFTPTTMGTYSFSVVATDGNGCVSAPSASVTVTVNGAPKITGTITDGDLQVCLGEVFGQPTAPTYEDNGFATTATWIYNNDEYNWNTVSTEVMNGTTISFVATNICGTDQIDAVFIVDTIPVAYVLSDTIICEDGIALLTTTGTYREYQWYMDGVPVPNETAATYDFHAESVDLGTYHFTVVVTDYNGCASVETVNASTNNRYFAETDAVTVVVDGNPRFVFTHNGVQTYEFDATTATSTVASENEVEYTWMVDNVCGYYPDTLVFVSFDIYHNGTLIEDANIGDYIVTQTNGMNTYVTSNEIHWTTYSGQPQSSVMYYNYARSNDAVSDYLNSNHFPVSKMGHDEQFDCFYLHFMDNRPITMTINGFRQPGEYRIEYRLISTSNVNWLNHTYGAENKRIGSNNAVLSSSILDTLSYDAIVINVTGANVASNAPAVTPAPATVESSDAPTMEVYPNPAQTTAQVNALIRGIQGKTVVSIVNLAGKVVETETISIATPEYLYKRDLNKLVPGVYFIYVQGENAKVSRKLVITK